MGPVVFLALMLATMPTVVLGTQNCFIDIEPDAGVMWLHEKTTNHGTWVRAPEEIFGLTQLEASWDAGFAGTTSFSGDISYEIDNSETYINIHLTCNIWTGDSGHIVWTYTKCTMSGHQMSSYICSASQGSDSFIVRPK